MSTVIVIPARKGSTRFPNKPLAKILGKQLLYRTWQIAKSVNQVDEVYIATDDEEIQSAARKFGAEVLMTSPDCENGTVRVYDAVQQLRQRPEIAINLQGDAVLTPPWVIQAVVDALQSDPGISVATPATCLDWKRYDEFVESKSGGRVSGTLVVFDLNRNALYFSKGMLPFVRGRNHVGGNRVGRNHGPSSSENSPAYRHIGLYGYRVQMLSRYVELKPTPLEEVEKLEQLRLLENGIPIRIILVDYRGRTHWSVDNPEDIRIVEEILSREGELVSDGPGMTSKSDHGGKLGQ